MWSTSGGIAATRGAHAAQTAMAVWELIDRRCRSLVELSAWDLGLRRSWGTLLPIPTGEGLV